MEFARDRHLPRDRSTEEPTGRSEPPALRVGALDDPAERDADRVAGRVMAALARRAAAPVLATTATSRIRRRAAPDGVVGPEGGPVPDDVQRRLSAARGGGQPLPPALRAPMEQAFGADFGGVRLHQGARAESLNDALGAHAFTVGRDVFVRGRLDAARSSDQHLLAHELAHTVQQGGGTSRPAARTIRRDVGFEFEVGSWTVEDLQYDLSDEEDAGTATIDDAKMDPAGLDKDTVIYAGRNFNLKPDQAADGTWHIEFVVEPPFPETTKARSKLTSSIKDLRKLGDRMIAHGKTARLLRTGDPFPKFMSDDLGFDRLGVLITPRGKMEAEPQTTAGVRLDQLADLMLTMSPGALLGETADETQARTTGGYYLSFKNPGDAGLVAAAPVQVRNRFATFPGRTLHSPDTPSDELVSYLALIRTYLLKAAQGAAYAKSIAPIMARTDFGEIFRHLPEATYYTSYRDEFVALALHVSGMAGQGAQPFFTGPSTYTDPVHWAAIQAALTRQQWLADLPLHIDRVTETHFPDRAVAGYLFGLGKLGSKTDTVGKRGGSSQTEAPVFELRRMAGYQDHRVWEPLTLELFDYFVALNRQKTPTFTATRTAAKARSI